MLSLEDIDSGKTPTKCLLLARYDSETDYQRFNNHDLTGGEFTSIGDFHFSFRLRHRAVLPVSALERAALEFTAGAMR